MLFDDRYLCVYLSSAKIANDFKLILEFYNEIANTSLKNKDVGALQIKFQWFIGALLSKELTNHPIIDKLKPIILKYNLDVQDIIKIIETKVIDLDKMPFKSMENLIDYARNTSGILWKIAYDMLNTNNKNPLHSNIIIHTGTIFALIGIIRNIPYNYNRGIYQIIYSQNILEKDFPKIIIQNTKDVVIYAKNNLTEILSNTKNIKRNNKPLLFLNTISLAYIKNIESVNYDVFKANIYNIPKKYYLQILFKYIFKWL